MTLLDSTVVVVVDFVVDIVVVVNVVVVNVVVVNVVVVNVVVVVVYVVVVALFVVNLRLLKAKVKFLWWVGGGWGGVWKVIFMSNSASVLRLCCVVIAP